MQFHSKKFLMNYGPKALKSGAVRVIKRFAFLPIKIKERTVWLEWVYIAQRWEYEKVDDLAVFFNYRKYKDPLRRIVGYWNNDHFSTESTYLKHMGWILLDLHLKIYSTAFDKGSIYREYVRCSDDLGPYAE